MLANRVKKNGLARMLFWIPAFAGMTLSRRHEFCKRLFDRQSDFLAITINELPNRIGNLEIVCFSSLLKPKQIWLTIGEGTCGGLGVEPNKASLHRIASLTGQVQ